MNPSGQRSRKWLGISALLVVALAAGIGIAVWSGGSAPAPAPPPVPWSLSAPLVVPPPSKQLQAAQVAAIEGDPVALVRLEQVMRAHRASWQGVPAEVTSQHAAADRLMDAGQPVEAARAVASIVEKAPPAGDGGLADSRRVLIQDAYFRLCRLALGAGQAIVTSVQTHQALALGEPDDLFVTNLLLVRAAASDRTGETAQAQADRQRLRRLLPQTAAQ